MGFRADSSRKSEGIRASRVGAHTRGPRPYPLKGLNSQCGRKSPNMAESIHKRLWSRASFLAALPTTIRANQFSTIKRS